MGVVQFPIQMYSRTPFHADTPIKSKQEVQFLIEHTTNGYQIEIQTNTSKVSREFSDLGGSN